MADETVDHPTTSAPTTAHRHGSPHQDTEVIIPRRYIFDDDDMAHFLQSPAKNELLRVTAAMAKACGTTLPHYQYDPQQPLRGLGPALASLHGSLRAMTTWIFDYPPVDRSQARFGNPSFKPWHARLVERAPSIVATLLRFHDQQPPRGQQDQPEEEEYEYDAAVLEAASEEGYQAAGRILNLDLEQEGGLDLNVVMELSTYLQAAFGHAIRLDYGTGHECSFQVFMYCLCKLYVLGGNAQQPPSTYQLKAATLSIWQQYLVITRQLQTDYMLEPAGSHGVWGLDDYHCLPFYFGAAQLDADADGDCDNPKVIHQDTVLKSSAGDTYLYLGCIRYIKSLKKGVPFFESSPMLNDISHLPSWSKVSAGLLRLFEGEVLKKRQVVQHFCFGRIFAANWTPSEQLASRQAPTETFRTPAMASVGPMVRAPWATLEVLDEPGDAFMLPTKAPWAK